MFEMQGTRQAEQIRRTSGRTGSSDLDGPRREECRQSQFNISRQFRECQREPTQALQIAKEGFEYARAAQFSNEQVVEHRKSRQTLHTPTGTKHDFGTHYTGRRVTIGYYDDGRLFTIDDDFRTSATPGRTLPETWTGLLTCNSNPQHHDTILDE